MNLKPKKENWQKEAFGNPQYWGKVIAIWENNIIYSGETYVETIEQAKLITPKYSLYKVPSNPSRPRILPFKVKSINRHEWASL